MNRNNVVYDPDGVEEFGCTIWSYKPATLFGSDNLLVGIANSAQRRMTKYQSWIVMLNEVLAPSHAEVKHLITHRTASSEAEFVIPQIICAIPPLRGCCLLVDIFL
ncbi:MAG TPA: hypothetical protein DCM62_06030 [Bacteroidales bacterium]|nr:hypothetical protein [Bacteroidales bacterium]